MKPVVPIVVVDLFEPMLDRLLQLLRRLSEQEWGSATPCEEWTVKDIALHLLGDEIGQLSRGRDKDTSSTLPPGADLVSSINRQNELWVEATRRMSPRLICDLLDVTGHEVVQYFKSLDLMAMNGIVSWAGPDPTPVWFDVAREYTERWHHQQHIREAVGQPGLTEAVFLTPVLDTFVRALPYTFRAVSAPEQTVVRLTVVGDAGQSWCLLRKEAHWSLFTETPFSPAAIVTLDQETAWKLFTKGIAKEKARGRAHIQGSEVLASTLFEAVAIIA
jgi:uncharacterized protein (TIGR03083 family)